MKSKTNNHGFCLMPPPISFAWAKTGSLLFLFLHAVVSFALGPDAPPSTGNSSKLSIAGENCGASDHCDNTVSGGASLLSVLICVRNNPNIPFSAAARPLLREPTRRQELVRFLLDGLSEESEAVQWAGYDFFKETWLFDVIGPPEWKSRRELSLRLRQEDSLPEPAELLRHIADNPLFCDDIRQDAALRLPFLHDAAKPFLMKRRALRWMAERQQNSGAWGEEDRIRLTGLAVIAFLSNREGVWDADGQFNPQMRRAVEFLEANLPSGHEKDIATAADRRFALLALQRARRAGFRSKQPVNLRVKDYFRSRTAPPSSVLLNAFWRLQREEDSFDDRSVPDAEEFANHACSWALSDFEDGLIPDKDEWERCFSPELFPTIPERDTCIGLLILSGQEIWSNSEQKDSP